PQAAFGPCVNRFYRFEIDARRCAHSVTPLCNWRGIGAAEKNTRPATASRPPRGGLPGRLE
ncbi:MAG TPA: hypothetical protein PLF51_05425, partial [Candidatus Hydrogenedentes bacterium]|nr:hypothetical protein [Candidatus Hydrogenedentota bacterium]